MIASMNVNIESNWQEKKDLVSSRRNWKAIGNFFIEVQRLTQHDYLIDKFYLQSDEASPAS